jgi:hypothetical protein
LVSGDRRSWRRLLLLLHLNNRCQAIATHNPCVGTTDTTDTTVTSSKIIRAITTSVSAGRHVGFSEHEYRYHHECEDHC